MMTSMRVAALIAMVVAAALAPTPTLAQGVTTGSMNGNVTDQQGQPVSGANVIAIHLPSGTAYEATSRADGRFFIPGMRVGGPYSVTVSYQGTGTAFEPTTQEGITVNLGVAAELPITVRTIAVTETVTVTASTSEVFSSTRTGAATALLRDDLATLPTVSGRITDVTRLTPQAGGNGTFAGQDNRANNITIDGSYFNSSFGLATTTGGPGDRTGVAPVSLEVIEQVQVNVAPYDVRQGNFVGANVNTVTRSGTNRFTGSVYTRFRNESFVGTKAAGLPYNPGDFETTNTGEWFGGPILKNKLFFFQAYESQKDTRPLTPFTSNPGGAPVGGNTTRVLASDLSGLSSFLQQNFNYTTGPFDNIPDETPGKPWMLKFDYALNNSNKINFRYNQLNSSTDVNQSGSSSLGTSRPTNSTNFLTYENSNYEILENIKSGIGEWNTVFGNFTNNLLVGYTNQDESRTQIGLFPFVVIGDGLGSAYTSFGSEPFTPFNLLDYQSFQAQNSLTMFRDKHSFTLGGALEKFHSDNSFYFGIQSSYSYNTLADFYTDARDYLANPGRTTSPVALNIFQTRFLLQPGETAPPMQELDVWYGSVYLQDEWRPRSNVTVTGGVRLDIPSFGNTSFPNPAADALTFRDQDGSPVQYSSGALPDTTIYWSPRVGFNWDVFDNRTTQVRGGTGLFSGKPPYVWISNQIGNTGVLTGLLDIRNSTAFPFNPDPDRYKPAPTGTAASSYELNVTDESFRFPQTWRTNIGVDQRLPWGLIGTVDFMYNRDRNAPVYLNANLPAAQAAFTGVDARPRWLISNAFPSCNAPTAGPCVTRINNAAGNQITNAYVIKNSSENYSWNISGALNRPFRNGVAIRGGYNYGISRSLVEPSSTAGSSWGSANPITFDPNNPALAYSTNSPGHRVFLQSSYTARYFNFGSTTFSAFYEGRTNGNTSWIFSGDANGDTVQGNDLIYIPRNASEMNFRPLTTGGRTFTAAEQASAFESLIEADDYLRKHRGGYAERNAVFLPMVHRVDLSVVQDLFKELGSMKHTLQVRLDVTNFGNLLNDKWGVSQRLINNQILTSPQADANGALSYTMQTLSGNLITTPRQTAAGVNDVYVMMLSFRYLFN